MIEALFDRGNYWAIVGLMMIGLYITFQSENMIKRLVGLSIFQTSVFIFYITLGKVAGGTAPILLEVDQGGHHGGDHGPAHGAADGDHGADDHGAPETASISGPAPGPSGTADETAAGLSPPLSDAVADTYPTGAEPPVEPAASSLEGVYSNPLPHVLILTAIVVGVATLSVGLALVVRIREAYGTIEADDVRAIDIDTAEKETESDAAGAAA